MFTTLNPALRLSLLLFLLLNSIGMQSSAAELPLVLKVDAQPVRAQVRRIVEALQMLGSPLPEPEQKELQQALEDTDEAASLKKMQAVLDKLCLAGVNINAESRVKVQEGPATKHLVQQGWTPFLIKVHNEAGVTAPLRVQSPNAAPLVKGSSGSAKPQVSIKPSEVPERWLDVAAYTSQPLTETLSGLALEYRVLELYARDVGKREAKLSFDVGQGTQDLGFRNELNLLFDCIPAVEVVLDVIDDDGQPTVAYFTFRDGRGRLYPSRGRRLAPDLFFHDQVYRGSGESVMLPAGDYEVEYGRGPEYEVLKKSIHVPATKSHKENFRLKRWIHLAKLGWFSGDHHVHAAGCAHYESPSEGVQPADMMRHILGEDLNIGCVLSWGPCWYYQKQFFEGRVSDLSRPLYLMRYDVEVSGFPSSHAGHLCLLRLKEDDYPGAQEIEQWPSWDLPVLKWGKEQGGVVGFSHSGWGLEVDAQTLPTQQMPRFDGIGANEYIVDVAHDACDFISTVDTPSVWELNIWYHTLNCGYSCRISGETDFPCIYGERVGLGRSYVKLPTSQPLDYNAWTEGIQSGRCYVTDGLSHLFDYSINGLGVGEKQGNSPASTLAVKTGQSLAISVNTAALLAPSPREDIRKRGLNEQPYWHVERARVENTRKVPVELIVNGNAVATQMIEADGQIRKLEFEYKPQFSSWAAIRIFPSAHTNPIFIEVDGKPIRASRQSAKWCQTAVETCWKQKAPAIRDAERKAARDAYDYARMQYERIEHESVAD